MPRLDIVDLNKATGEQKEILSQIQGAFGTTPNMFKTIANSTPALKMMWSAFGALGSGKIGSKLSEQIAVAVANANRCEYCLAAHTALGKGAGLTAEAMSQAQIGKSSDPKTQAALNFSLSIVKHRANISPDDFAMMKKVGFDEEEIAEVLAHVALNIFTNYTNVAFDVTVDFPKVELQ